MAEATFVSGNPIMVDYTPSGAVAAGEIVVLNGYPFIAHRDIAANELGSVAAGGGVYDIIKDGTTGPVIDMGEGVAWIAGSNLATDVLTTNVHLGSCVKDAGTNEATVRVYHNPNQASTNDDT